MNVPKLRFKDDDGREFPEWEVATLKDVSITYYQGINTAADKIEYFENGVPIIQAKHITGEYLDFSDARGLNETDYQKYKDKYNPKINDLLISNIGTLGKVVLVESNIDFLIAWNIFKVTLNTKNCYPRFIKEFLKKISSDGYFESIKTGNATKFINKSDMLAINVDLPSIAEQTKIANFLTAIDEKISQLTQKYDLLKQYKKGVMQRIFSQKLRFKDEDGREFPEWGIKLLGEISKFLDGRRRPIKESDRSKMKGEYPYYGASGIIDYVNDYIFDENIILLGEDGENILSRNLPLAFKVSGKCWVNNHAHVIKPNLSTNIDFLTQYLDSISYVKYNTGTAQPKLNQEVCRTIPLNLPSLPEQTKIANFLTAIDDKITQAQTQLNAVKQYKKGLLQQLFV